MRYLTIWMLVSGVGEREKGELATKLYIPYSLELTPPSIISKPRYFLLKYAAEVYLSLI